MSLDAVKRDDVLKAPRGLFNGLGLSVVFFWLPLAVALAFVFGWLPW